MKRRVAQQGPNTLGVSLPSKWVKSHSIKKGDEIDVLESGANLIVGSTKEPVSEAIIHIPTKDMPLDKEKNPDRYIIRTIVINALRKGHNRIKVTFESNKILPQINNCVDEVLGYEITEQSSTGCVIESIVNLINTDFTKQLTKFRHVISNFSNLVYNNIVGNEKNFEEIKSTFLMLEKNYNTLCRFLMSDCHNQTKEKMFLFLAVNHLYEGARNMFYASQILNNSNIKLGKQGLRYAKDVFEYVNDVIGFVASKDIKEVSDLNIRKNKLVYHEVNKIISKNSKENPIILQLCFVARRMWDSVGLYLGSII